MEVMVVELNHSIMGDILGMRDMHGRRRCWRWILMENIKTQVRDVEEGIWLVPLARRRLRQVLGGEGYVCTSKNEASSQFMIFDENRASASSSAVGPGPVLLLRSPRRDRTYRQS